MEAREGTGNEDSAHVFRPRFCTHSLRAYLCSGQTERSSNFAKLWNMHHQQRGRLDFTRDALAQALLNEQVLGNASARGLPVASRPLEPATTGRQQRVSVKAVQGDHQERHSHRSPTCPNLAEAGFFSLPVKVRFQRRRMPCLGHFPGVND